MKVRTYGGKPYKIAVVHGGPGALGEVAGMARRLSSSHGVIEPLQSQYTIERLVEELKDQIEEYCKEPITLIGHSWGAWLIALFAEKYPEHIKKLILIGSGPLSVEYVSEIGARRKRNLTKEEGIEFDKLAAALNDGNIEDKDTKIERLGVIVHKADNFSAFELETDKEDFMKANGEMYSKIWSEAAKLREEGDLLNSFEKINVPIVLIQGDRDPHPAK